MNEREAEDPIASRTMRSRISGGKRGEDFRWMASVRLSFANEEALLE